jgi:hypothetical protein
MPFIADGIFLFQTYVSKTCGIKVVEYNIFERSEN